MDTWLLELNTWDLCLDARGNIALASAPYALAQSVASAIKTFLGEVYYDVTEGVPYFTQILGQIPPLGVFEEFMIQAALTVPEVVSATCVITSFVDRTISGQVQFVDSNGKTSTVSF